MATTFSVDDHLPPARPADPELLLRLVGDSPALPELCELMQRRLETERVRRDGFYEELREDQRTEFINGEVVRHAPASLRHAQVVQWLGNLLGNHVRSRGPGHGFVGGERLLVVTTRNDYEPDVLYYGPDKAAGLRPGQRKLPPPDLVVEVLSPGTEAIDRGVKFQDYARHGINEYWLVEPIKEQVDKFLLDPPARAYRAAGTCRARLAGATIASQTVPGFEVSVQALFDDAANLAALRRILLPGDPAPATGRAGQRASPPRPE